jgi:hypothetical protein
MRKSKNEKRIRLVLDAHLKAVATKDILLLSRSFSQEAIFFGTDDGEHWTFAELSNVLTGSENGWDMTECKKRSIQFANEDSASFFEVVKHVKYGLLRGSGSVVKNKNGDWVISQYVLSFSIPNDVVNETNILALLNS